MEGVQRLGSIKTESISIVITDTGDYTLLNTQRVSDEQSGATHVFVASPSGGERTLMRQFTYDICEY